MDLNSIDLAAIQSAEQLNGDPEGILHDPSSLVDPKAKRWRDPAFKDILHSFILREYRRDDIKITNKFAQTVYTAQYLTHHN